LDKPAVTELIQGEFNTKKLQQELDKILDPQHREMLFLDYFALEKKLGGTGASAKTAALIYKSIA
jgi:lipid-A-disaccharide synthase